MWTCPKCRRECDTPFCPLCGYEKPTQISETDLLITKVKKLQKRSSFLTASVIVLLLFVIVLTISCYNGIMNLNVYYAGRVNNLYELRLQESDRISDLENEVYREAPAEPEAPVADITGTYALSGAEMDGVEVPMEGAPEMSVILAEDGTVTLTSDGEAETGTWAQEGNELILTSDEGDVMTMTLEDGNLVIEESGMKMIFSR